MITSCRRAQQLYRPEQAAEYWYRVVSGLAKNSVDTARGRPQIVDFLLPGDFFGFTPCKRHHCAVEAVVDGTVIARYPRHRLEKMADADPQLARLIREMSFKTMSRLQTRIIILGRTTAVEKVGAFLLEMAGRLSDQPTEVIVLPMSRYDIADYLAISVETVSRALTNLRQRGMISLAGKRRVRIVDRRALEDGSASRNAQNPV